MAVVLRLHHHCRRCGCPALFLLVAALLLIASAIAARHAPIQETEFPAGVENRRRLGGPGSWPPSCRSRCGSCSPCRAVHVPIQPGVSFPLEYYPEAWRCKCGNSIYMP